MFREEVVKAQKQRLFGKVIVAQPVSLYMICLLLCIIFIIILLYLSQAHYSRKETVKGYLTPEKGVVKVFSNRTGVVESFYVNEGDRVEQGSELVKIKNSQSLSTGIELSVALSQELSQQILSFEQEYDAVTNMHQKDLTRIDHQLRQLNKSLSAISNAKNTNQKKLSLKEKQLQTNQQLNVKGYISSSQFDIVQEEYLEVLEANDRFELELASIQAEIASLESERLALPEKLILTQAAIKRHISELKAQVTELDNQYEFIKKAPEVGIVTAIQPSLGARVDASTPLLSIIPINSPLEIELLLPTRSAGFMQLGDKVKIRFDAFPYQKFGFITGEISNVDKALVLPTDKVLPIKVEEAIYRVRAKLHQQTVKAYGKEFPLKVGMTADADIILEKRSLLEWLLDPIYIIKGKIG